MRRETPVTAVFSFKKLKALFKPTDAIDKPSLFGPGKSFASGTGLMNYPHWLTADSLAHTVKNRPSEAATCINTYLDQNCTWLHKRHRVSSCSLYLSRVGPYDASILPTSPCLAGSCIDMYGSGACNAVTMRAVPSLFACLLKPGYDATSGNPAIRGRFPTSAVTKSCWLGHLALAIKPAKSSSFTPHS